MIGIFTSFAGESLDEIELAFNSLKTIRNDTVSQPIKQGIIGL